MLYQHLKSTERSAWKSVKKVERISSYFVTPQQWATKIDSSWRSASDCVGCFYMFVRICDCIFILSCICICRLYFKFLAVFVFVDICICICRLYFKFLVVFVFVDKGKVEAAGKFQGSSEWVGWPPLLTDTPPLHSYSPSHHPQHPSPPSIHFLLFSWFYQPLPHFSKSNSSHFLLILFPLILPPSSSFFSSLQFNTIFLIFSLSSIKTQYFLQNQLYVCLQNLTSLMTTLVRMTI